MIKNGQWFLHGGRWLGSAILTLTTLLTMNAAEVSKESAKPKTSLATFGGGCFWCVEAAFETFKGVKAVMSGYAGGETLNPSYEEVCTGRTGHAEVVQVQFDPSVISFETLLEIFWEAHDPTTSDRQGADAGTQYRSIILYHDEAQKRAAEAARKSAQKKFSDPIVTQIVPLAKFYPAEDHHQDYFRRNPRAPYCAVVISPKMQKLQKVKKAIEDKQH